MIWWRAGGQNGIIYSIFFVTVWSAKRYFDFYEIITEQVIRAWDERDFYEFRMENYKLTVEAATKVYRARRIARIHRVGRAFGLKFKFDVTLLSKNSIAKRSNSLTAQVQ